MPIDFVDGPTGHHARVDGRELRLTPTELRLLQALCSHPGRVFSRGELVELAMPGTIVLERTVDVHVRALRRKLGASARQIETVRYEGYRFTPEIARSGSP